MGFTDGKWEQGGLSTDLTLFLGADQFTDFAGLATLPAAPAAGLLFKVVPAADAAKFFITPESMLLRSGQFAVPLFSGFTGTLGTGTANAGADQNAFGTAAAGPGPSTVSGTSGPLALPVGVPPQPASTLATLKGGVAGPQPKGIQINSVDVIYQVLTAAATLATIGLTTTKFANGVAPVVANLIALGANGLPTAVSAQPTVTNVPVAAPALITSLVDTQVILNINLTAGAGATIEFFGAVLKCSYNFN
jgi:hypothetical protein